MVIKQRVPSTEEDLEATVIPSMITFTGQYNISDFVTYTFGGSIALQPIEYDGEKVLLNSKYMNVGQAYSFIFSGHNVVAIKQSDGTIDFYYLD